MDVERCLVWNVRGLNARWRRDLVRMVVEQEKASLVYLQETKLDVIDSRMVIDLCGSSFDYFYLPANNT